MMTLRRHRRNGKTSRQTVALSADLSVLGPRHYGSICVDIFVCRHSLNMSDTIYLTLRLLTPRGVPKQHIPWA